MSDEELLIVKKKEEAKKRSALYRENHREEILEKKRLYREKHKDRLNEYKRIYDQGDKEKMLDNSIKFKEQNKELKRLELKERNDRLKEERRLKKLEIFNTREDRKKKYGKEYRIINKEYFKDYNIINKEHLIISRRKRNKERLLNDPLYKLSRNIRTLIRQSFKSKSFMKGSKTQFILGCSLNEFKQYIESMFEPWMNWDNYGNRNGIATSINYSWDIDHIIPISTATSEEDIIKLNHYTNLQPLCSYVNRNIKRDIINYKSVA